MTEGQPDPAHPETPHASPPAPQPLPVSPPGPDLLGYASPGSVPYVTARFHGRIVVGLLWVAFSLELLLLWPQIEYLGRWRAYFAGTYVESGRSAGDIASLVIVRVYWLVWVALTVFWMLWVHRTYRNLTALGAEGLRASPGWAVAYNFIPVLNLFWPYRVMRETWRASDPRHAGGTDWKRYAAPALIAWWWALSLTSFAVNTASQTLGRRTDNDDVIYAFAWVDVAMRPFDAVFILLEIVLIRRLTDLQDARADVWARVPFASAAVPASPELTAGPAPH